MHQALGTFAHGGATRFSLGAFTTADEIDVAVTALGEIAAVAVN
jgi:cysteine sulfinate desulfinase/cysteine desulfurase-like protein